MVHNIAPSGAWRYSDKHDVYQVAPSDVWKVGQHTFICGDMETMSWSPSLETTPTFMYADPPYSAGVARSYRTKAGVDGSKGRSVDFENLIRCLLTPASQHRLVAYVETAVKSGSALISAVMRMGGTVTGTWDITFYNTRPATLIAADFRDVPLQDHPDFTGQDDMDTPTIAIRHWQQRQPHGLVIDPCAGRGLTARSAQQTGFRSLNVELSPFRMAEAIASLVSIGAPKPERING